MTLISDVLGLHVSSKFILVGHGNQAVLHTPKESVQLPLGARQSKVHGFALSSCHDAQHLLLLYGENAFSLFIYSVNEKSEPFQLIYEGETRDWINAAVIFDNDEKKDWKLVVHMSHSAFLYLQCSISSMVCSVLELASCTDCSMLYHTRLYGNNYNDLAIISGNAFGELLIWHTQCPVDSDTINCTKIYPLLLRIQAHNGVIYSINFNLALKILVTTSDDRSVKFWKIQKVGSWKTFYIKPMFSCFGHTSRVMSSIIVENVHRIQTWPHATPHIRASLSSPLSLGNTVDSYIGPRRTPPSSSSPGCTTAIYACSRRAPSSSARNPTGRRNRDLIVFESS
ncbi:WD repeat-containing protein 6 isoform X2 [Drosophila pseudoobscura]|uniref:tRNA (34-2'-O)-methyltransferase regulator WDR6 n=1 Tax=Drosophila pseudoobscura pseudoobscura TaxID=46245 RepID=A0A6I8W435_DROPS|nr:WD repeat-containing protein 6 isoform X2 [Drosophila pseudoobscura]